MSDGFAYRSSAPHVLEAFDAWVAQCREVEAKRTAVEEKYGRPLVVVRSGFGHGTPVAGFESTPADADNPALREDRRHHYQVPRLGTTAGKALAAELGELSQRGPALPGMPAFHIGGTSRGLAVAAPALRRVGDVVWAYWELNVSGSTSLDEGLWEPVPLSAYYAAMESADADESVSA
jgi:hypothetical protein